MKVLFTRSARKESGSWQIRGKQIADAIGGLAVLNATDDHIRSADIIVIVKSFTRDLVNRIKKLGKPIVYDILDFWPQPEGNVWGREEAINQARYAILHSGASFIIASTHKMEEIDGNMPGVAVPHHAMPSLTSQSIREKVIAVGYQ